jgi:hypothetical protein
MPRIVFLIFKSNIEKCELFCGKLGKFKCYFLLKYYGMSLIYYCFRNPAFFKIIGGMCPLSPLYQNLSDFLGEEKVRYPTPLPLPPPQHLAEGLPDP